MFEIYDDDPSQVNAFDEVEHLYSQGHILSFAKVRMVLICLPSSD